MKTTFYALVVATAALWLSSCAEQTVNTIAPGSFSGMNSGSVYVPVFDAKPSVASAATTEFITDLAASTRATIVRGDSIAHDSNPDLTSGSMLQDVNAGIETARQRGASLMVSGEIETHRASGGYSAVAIFQIITLADGATVSRLRQEYTAADERQAALGVARQAALVMAAAF
ncbi:hypothetical protein BH09VER1_BH09VER1_43520 [soil metagenome]